jgi:hypothetical protein
MSTQDTKAEESNGEEDEAGGDHAEGDNGNGDDSEGQNAENDDAEGDNEEEDDTESVISIEDADADPHANWGRSFSFTLFPKLPAELRVAIWNAILPGPRFVEIESSKVFLKELPDEDEVETWHATGIEKAPVGFFICRESRAEVLKWYSPIKSTDGSPTWLVNFKRDILCFRFWSAPNSILQFLNNLPDDKLEKNMACLLIDNVAPNAHSLYGHNFWMDKSLYRFKGLKEVFFVEHCSEEECKHKIIGFSGRNRKRLSKRYQLEGIEKNFRDISQKHPSWVPPNAGFGTLVLVL